MSDILDRRMKEMLFELLHMHAESQQPTVDRTYGGVLISRTNEPEKYAWLHLSFEVPGND
jgi:hypothetical protein